MQIYKINTKERKNMKIVAINTVDYGSTGRIMLEIAKHARKEGYQYQTFSTESQKGKKAIEKHTYYLSYKGYYIHYLCGRITGLNGFFSIIPTIRMLLRINKINPSIVHLHNIHGFCINIPILFNFLKRKKIQIIWTLHDCWSFTGHCAHYEMINCNKWRNGCYQCPLYRDYPQSVWDNSKFMWKYKRRIINNLENLTLVTPSHWLEEQVKQSFLHDIPVLTINNGIDINIFKPTDSDFREKYNIRNRFIVLGVAFGWGEKKGLDIFQHLAERLPDNYSIVLVGTTEKIDSTLNAKIIAIHRTEDQQQLAGIYTAADVFVNPTREDTFPTVNIEALACGTPIITFNTGGSPEIIDETCGVVVEKNKYDELEAEVIRICENQPYDTKTCRDKALKYREVDSYAHYLSLYKEKSLCSLTSRSI